jgi:hypothetical protein
MTSTRQKIANALQSGDIAGMDNLSIGDFQKQIDPYMGAGKKFDPNSWSDAGAKLFRLNEIAYHLEANKANVKDFNEKMEYLSMHMLAQLSHSSAGIFVQNVFTLGLANQDYYFQFGYASYVKAANNFIAQYATKDALQTYLIGREKSKGNPKPEPAIITTDASCEAKLEYVFMLFEKMNYYKGNFVRGQLDERQKELFAAGVSQLYYMKNNEGKGNTPDYAALSERLVELSGVGAGKVSEFVSKWPNLDWGILRA